MIDGWTDIDLAPITSFFLVVTMREDHTIDIQGSLKKQKRGASIKLNIVFTSKKTHGSKIEKHKHFYSS